MKKAVLYCRTAVGDHLNSQLNKQEQNLKKFAREQNYEIIEIVKETSGGMDLHRSGINKIYEIANDSEVNAVIAETISRYGRCSYRKISDFIKSLNKKKIEVLTVSEGNLRNIIPLLKSIS